MNIRNRFRCNGNNLKTLFTANENKPKMINKVNYFGEKIG